MSTSATTDFLRGQMVEFYRLRPFETASGRMARGDGRGAGAVPDTGGCTPIQVVRMRSGLIRG